MYKMLIVDDNLLAREGLLNIINWDEYGIEIVAMCENGQQALDFMEQNQIDIVLSDVEMPVLNGIEFLKILRNSGNNVKFLFMSCYDEFDFVKSAIDMDATGYILKPVITEELESAIIKILNIYKIQSDDNKQKEMLLNMVYDSLPVLRENFFRELMLDISTEPEQIKKTLALLRLDFDMYKKIQIALIKIYESSHLSYDSDNIIATLAISDKIKTIVKDGVSYNPVTISNTDIAVVCIFDSQYSEKILDDLIEIKEYCQNTLGINTSVGVSNASEQLSCAGKLFKEADIAANTKYYSEVDRIVLFSDVESYNENFDNVIDLKDLHTEVKKIIAECDVNLAGNIIDKYLSKQQEPHSINFVKCFSLSLLNLIEITLVDSNIDFNSIIDHMVMWEKLANMETILNIKQWFINIFKSVFETIENSKSMKDIKIVEKIKEIIVEEYANHITIDSIADKVFFSSVHINNIFKKETGVAIFDYLVEYRMKKAAELLKQKDSKIYSVAQAVGYKNLTHFKLLFTKYSLMTPMQFKRLYEEEN